MKPRLEWRESRPGSYDWWAHCGLYDLNAYASGEAWGARVSSGEPADGGEVTYLDGRYPLLPDAQAAAEETVREFLRAALAELGDGYG